ncbi:Arginine--tRNA ligase [bacterium HR21]|nr:Arginine--tRNA ligase [bacterium HR21]
MLLEQYLEVPLRRALDAIGAPEVTPEFEVPRVPEHGDIATPVALHLARPLRRPPRQIAEELVRHLELSPEDVRAEIAGPGFINFHFTADFFTRLLRRIADLGDAFGRLSLGAGKRANVEYVSANPTGPLHLGHGRNAALGDTIATLLEWLGYEVTREYYFNNAGTQMALLGQSVYARYRQLLGDASYPFPENGYHGDYIWEIARQILQQYGDSLREETPEALALCRREAEAWCFARIRHTLERMGIRHDLYFNEDSLYRDGKVQAVLNALRERGLLYERDGALWIALSRFGRQDRVLVKSTGEGTYRLPDIAYHRDKLERGYDLIVDVLGADHITTIEDVITAVGALGYDTSRIKVVLHQFVTLTEGGQQVKMSKRSGKSYTLDELLDELGPDVVRFFFLMRAPSTHLEFELELARQQTEANPVFYLQYAHARICSIFRHAERQGIVPKESAEVSCLTLPPEQALIKLLVRFPERIRKAAQLYEPQLLVEYLREVAQAFHTFYHECRIVGAETPAQMHARFVLARVTQRVLRNGLRILGVSAPERMERVEEIPSH